jgi:hypothetical protein
MDKIPVINIETKKIEYNKTNIINLLYYASHRLLTKTELKLYKIKLLEDEIRDMISQNEDIIPLYDIYTSNIYLINAENLFKRITYNSYRFPNQNLLSTLEEEISKQNKLSKDVLIQRQMQKFILMKAFMKNFNLKILENTFYRSMYKNSPELGKNLLFCKRPSFNKYIHNSKPYYTKSEIINISKNMGKKILIEKLSDSALQELCKFVNSNDISAKILFSHQLHTINQDMLGLIQYYTVQGAYNINRYLRMNNVILSPNDFLNGIILNLHKLCITAPAFDKNYIIYRFIKDDGYLSTLRINDVYESDSFISTTRDPFYRSDLYNFGFILLKIHIPKNIIGVGLSLENISHFPEEQEIILPPTTKLKLIARNADIEYYHTDLSVRSKINTLYEFKWIGNSKLENSFKKKSEIQFSHVDFLKEHLSKNNILGERIKNFYQKYITDNSLNQFTTTIGNKDFTVIFEDYNSTGAYKNFYSIKTEKGVSMYVFIENYLLFLLEIGTINNIDQIHLNYFVRYNTLNKNKIITDEDLLYFISSVGYYFGIEHIIIYSEYKPCFIFKTNIQRLTNQNEIKFNLDESTQNELIGNYCEDFYMYIKHRTKRFNTGNINQSELNPKFSYYDLDQLSIIKVDGFLSSSDDEIYQLYVKAYKLINSSATIAEYMIWIIENKCYLITNFIKKLVKIYPEINPFFRDMYILNPSIYLYNRGKIMTYDTFYDIDIDERTFINRSNEYRINLK